MTAYWVLTGAVTPTTARVRARIDGSAARLWVSPLSDLSGAQSTDATVATTDGHTIATFEVVGLDADTTYYYKVEVDGLDVVGCTGQFRTHPPLGLPASFTLLSASCGGLGNPGEFDTIVDRVSNHPVHDEWYDMKDEVLGFVHMGDWGYRDLGSGRHGESSNPGVEAWLRAYHDNLTFNNAEGLNARQNRLFRHMPLTSYVWDDHDYGPNNSDTTFPYKDRAAEAYRAAIPHYPLEHPGALYHSWQIGRVLFMIADLRYHRDPGVTLLGADQLNWMDQVLGSSDAEALCWFSPPWTGWSITNWEGEKQTVIDMMNDHGWAHRMVTVAGDMHALAIESPVANPGGWPHFQFAPIDGDTGVPPDIFDTGYPLAARGQYGKLRFEDTGGNITIRGECWTDGGS